ncbi:hypothetical protein FHS55_002129 [Angulomicrobium tetraedrale]|uniref:Uncharacterized protein n=1 Tax=Ancylobacter tetraedralis TaxID=217068 RepID=A0A839Z9W4_9HYPH|nr:hypothetical protein [Ancylobacter tetraedralis]MBB3771530.1 hypothetical protein [Ancylobacter tetraedralis]
MLARAALRLSAIEALCPTASVLAGTGEGFPTMAQHRVFDSRQVLVNELDKRLPGTPCLSVYTEDTMVERRGGIATSTIGDASADLIVVVEIAQKASDEDGEFAQAVIEGDALMRLTLEALGAQVRRVFTRDEKAAGLRRVLMSVQSIKVEPYALPQYGVRMMRDVMTFTCRIADDKYTDAPGLPEPLKRVAEDLPDGAYAKAKLIELGAAFAATTRTPLAGMDIHPTAGDGPAITPPIGG